VATTGTTARENGLAILGFHTGTETVGLRPLAIIRLKRTLWHFVEPEARRAGTPALRSCVESILDYTAPVRSPQFTIKMLHLSPEAAPAISEVIATGTYYRSGSLFHPKSRIKQNIRSDLQGFCRCATLVVSSG
jgi:hypothetical protein